MTYKSFHGEEIASVFEDLAKLRISVFKAFPYLYEGTIDYEKEYLKVYSNSEKSLLFTVFDDSEMVGVTTCIPLMDESDEVKKPFIEAGMDISAIFYFGESILQPSYRGLGIGNRFFEERENHAKSFGQYSLACFCAVQRPDNHPMKPGDYHPLDNFWIKKGYEKSTILQTQFSWLDIGNTVSSEKTMLFWTKNI